MVRFQMAGKVLLSLSSFSQQDLGQKCAREHGVPMPHSGTSRSVVWWWEAEVVGMGCVLFASGDSWFYSYFCGWVPLVPYCGRVVSVVTGV